MGKNLRKGGRKTKKPPADYWGRCRILGWLEEEPEAAIITQAGVKTQDIFRRKQSPLCSADDKRLRSRGLKLEGEKSGRFFLTSGGGKMGGPKPGNGSNFHQSCTNGNTQTGEKKKKHQKIYISINEGVLLRRHFLGGLRFEGKKDLIRGTGLPQTGRRTEVFIVR